MHKCYNCNKDFTYQGYQPIKLCKNCKKSDNLIKQSKVKSEFGLNYSDFQNFTHNKRGNILYFSKKDLENKSIEIHGKQKYKDIVKKGVEKKIHLENVKKDKEKNKHDIEKMRRNELNEELSAYDLSFNGFNELHIDYIKGKNVSIDNIVNLTVEDNFLHNSTNYLSIEDEYYNNLEIEKSMSGMYVQVNDNSKKLGDVYKIKQKKSTKFSDDDIRKKCIVKALIQYKKEDSDINIVPLSLFMYIGKK
jgi:hypothetical protein